MCWNQYVSINTFAFGIFGLLLFAFNNTYSQYRLPAFNNPYTYLFMLSIILMQLVEFFLWRNLKNKSINRIISTMGLLLIFLQPAASILLIRELGLRNKLLALYGVLASVVFVYNLATSDIHTTVSPCKHLSWNWVSYGSPLADVLVKLGYLVFLFFPLMYNKYYLSLIFLAVYMGFIYYYNKTGSAGSLWCLSANVIMVYLLIRVLLVMPLREVFGRVACS
jgi:hypothetical protein